MTSWSEIVTLVLKMLVAQYQTHGFWNWEILWDHFHEPQLYLEVKKRMEGMQETKDDFKK